MQNFGGERRVALSPQAVEVLVGRGFKVVIEEGAGARAAFGDDMYRKAGATIQSKEDAYNSNIVLKVIFVLF